MTDAVAVSAETRKRLGQFFTGEPLARLLAALAGGRTARTVIDPMAGSGDMLIAALALNANAEVTAIEIEPVAATRATERLGQTGAVRRGNAFDPLTWEGLRCGWELVITNPPYVRYQLGSSDGNEDFDIPSADRVRSGLVEILTATSLLEPVEREALLYCARSYSGLGDLAVPSWLLCAAQVAVGGRLAVLVPNTWLSRDYAAPVLYVLRRFFDIEYVVEDEDMAWFKEALVRTTLVVARRTLDKGTPFDPNVHLNIALPSSLADERSVVGAAFPASSTPELDFAAAAAQLLASGEEGQVAGAIATLSDESDLIETVRKAGRRQPWPCAVTLDLDESTSVPERLRRRLPPIVSDLVTLDAIGWKVGQGLRSGANDFFYLTRVNGGFASAILPGVTLHLPEDAVRPAVRRQADLVTATHTGAANSTTSCVLVLDRWALPEDIDGVAGPKPWKTMTGDLALLTRAAADHVYERGKTTVPIPELTAVRTNARPGSIAKDTPARFWYHLPPLTPRHVPELFLARVNGAHPLVVANPDGLVIDANFSTMWPVADDAMPAAALIAMLRSTWAVAYLEVAGTVLGGGALKVEASHLRRLLLPRITPGATETLEEFGGRLFLGTPIEMDAVDELVVGLLGIDDQEATVTCLRSFAGDLRRSRAGEGKEA